MHPRRYEIYDGHADADADADWILFLFALVTRNLFRISSVLAGCASEQRGVSGVCMRLCTGVQSNYQQPWGNPLIPAHEFTLPDRLIPYEITGHPCRGLGLGTGAYTHTHARTHRRIEYSQAAHYYRVLGPVRTMHAEPRCKINEEVRARNRRDDASCIISFHSRRPTSTRPLGARGPFNEVITFNEKLCARSRGICFAR